jgi:CheY-like chemotaxis protein
MPSSVPHAPLAIVLVEDNPVDVALMRRVLDTYGFTYHLRVLEDGEHALRFFDHLAQQAFPAPPDVLLLDLRLTRGSGQAVLQRLKALPVCARMRTIVVSGVDDVPTRLEAGRLGADAFFVKPATFTAFMELGDLITTVVYGHPREA